MASYSWNSRAANQPERELCPAFSPVVLGALGLFPGLGVVKLGLLGSGALAYDWSLGFNGLTYRSLYSTLAPYRGMRVPARFAVIVGSFLILLSAFGARTLLNFARTARQRQALCAIVAVLVLFDLRLTTQLVDYWPTNPSIYDRVTSDMVLAEVPPSHDVDYMYFSTRHWARLIGGYSGFSPRDADLERIFNEFPSRDAIAGFRRRGATHLTYNCAFERSLERCQRNLEIVRSNSSLELVAMGQWSGAEVTLYRFR